MFVKEVKFLKSVSINTDDVFIHERPEIIFVGRSNVWKSSIMNFIFSKKDMVKTSSRPGKTKTANLFAVNKKFYFTDLPWYGFARLWKDHKEELDALISWYVEEKKPSIKKVIILIDSKIWPQDSDLEMFKYLQELELPLLIVLSKIDRLNKGEIAKSLAHAKKVFFGQEIIAISSTKRIWIKELEKVIREALVK